MQKSEVTNELYEIALWGEKIYYPTYFHAESLEPLIPQLVEGQNILRQIAKGDLLELLNQYSRNLMRDPRVHRIEGVSFLSNWLRKANFETLVEKNFNNVSVLETFVGDKKRIKAQPKGIVCHWIAGNVPTLGMFSLFQGIFTGNINILRIPNKSHEIMINLLKVLKDTSIQTQQGITITGEQILRSIGILYFEKSFNKGNVELSNIADVRVVWGGEEAVKAITGVEKRAHTEDIIFGPKYSFAVIDKQRAESEELVKTLRLLVSDVFLFDQAACTSPHVIFIEKSQRQLQEIINILKELFIKQSERYPKIELSPYIANKIINIRALYALDLNKEVFCSSDNDWTILVNKEICLEEPIESRTIFIKEIEDVKQVIPLITKKIQTIGCGIDNKQKLIELAEAATYKGVARCVNIGQMHLYDSPWDGILMMSRLVNWTTLYFGE